MKRKGTQLAAVLLVLAACAGVLAWRAAHPPQQEPTYLLRYADNQPEDYPTTQGALYFAQLVEHWDQMAVLSLPFLYRNTEHMKAVLSGEIGDAFLSGLEDYGLVGLSWYDAGERHLYTTQQPIRRLEDLQGLTIRVQEAPNMEDMIRCLGAEPLAVPYDLVYSGLSTGAVDGAENNWPSYVATQHHQAAGYILWEGHVRIPEVQLLSAKTAQRLPEEYVDIILACGKESAEYEWALWAEREEEAIQSAQEAGVQVTHLEPGELERFREACRPLYDTYAQPYQELLEEIQAAGQEE